MKADRELLNCLSDSKSDVSLDLTDGYEHTRCHIKRAKIYKDHCQYFAVWYPENCNNCDTDGAVLRTRPEGTHSWNLVACDETALYNNLQILDNGILGGL